MKIEIPSRAGERPGMFDLYVGAAVTIPSRGVTGYVEKITHGARPYHVKTTDGQRYVCSNTHLVWASAEDKAEADAAKARADVAAREAWKELTLGTVVEVTGRPERYVVVGTLKNGRVNVAKLGGDGNRYVRAPLDMLTAVEVEVVTA